MTGLVFNKSINGTGYKISNKIEIYIFFLPTFAEQKISLFSNWQFSAKNTESKNTFKDRKTFKVFSKLPTSTQNIAKSFNTHLSRFVQCTLACTKFCRCARTSIPKMEIINKKYLIMKNKFKIIIFMRGGILSFSTNKAKNEKIQNSKYTKSFFSNFIKMGNIKSTQNELR